MDMTMRPLRAEERKYTYAQSRQLIMQTGAIGYLCGDFDSSGTGFHTTWFDEADSRNTGKFKAEINSVIDALRFGERYGGVLAGCSAMQRYGRSQPDSAFEGNCTTEYGVRIDTKDFAYLLRCIPIKGDYNFYCWCFEAKRLDRYLKQAEKGIRFIAPRYKELFRIPDGDKIRITYPDGERHDYTCRYIDGHHMEVGNPHWDSLYHICQSTGKSIVIQKGEPDYSPSKVILDTPEDDRRYADHMNENFHVTKAQEAAMLAGSMFGWQVPADDPKNYDENGQPIRPRQKERGDAQ